MSLLVKLNSDSNVGKKFHFFEKKENKHLPEVKLSPWWLDLQKKLVEVKKIAFKDRSKSKLIALSRISCTSDFSYTNKSQVFLIKNSNASKKFHIDTFDAQTRSVCMVKHEFEKRYKLWKPSWHNWTTGSPTQGAELKIFQRESSKNRNRLIAIRVEEVKLLVIENYEFEYRDTSHLKTLSPYSDYFFDSRKNSGILKWSSPVKTESFKLRPWSKNLNSSYGEVWVGVATKFQN